MQPKFREGLKQLAADAAPKKFAELKSEQQIAIMKKHEASDEFKTLRAYTIIGFLGDPKYGGNRDEIGWKYIGFEMRECFRHPSAITTPNCFPIKRKVNDGGGKVQDY